jgi:hypothetical protein
MLGPQEVLAAAQRRCKCSENAAAVTESDAFGQGSYCVATSSRDAARLIARARRAPRDFHLSSRFKKHGPRKRRPH